MKKYLFCLLLLIGSLSFVKAEPIRILFETSKGNFTIELSDLTPRHRDNMIAKVKAGAYDGLLFHRVIKHFVVQGGSPESRGLPAEVELPEGDDKERLPAEILTDSLLHFRGALGAAREPDEVNPERQSSAMQFYVVTGTYYTEDDLDAIAERNKVHYTPDQRAHYLKEGGKPSLDGAYTVFGRVVEGYDTINKIQQVSVGENDRPLKNVVIKRAIILPGGKK